MQAVKALGAQQERSHSPWCKCTLGQQHKYGSADLWLNTWAEVLKYIHEVGCEFREEEWMCRQSHYSYGVHRGGKFTRINCSCGYDPSEREWRAHMAAYHAMTDEYQADARRVHNELGAHFLQVLYMTPLLHLDMWRIGVDQLHLVYLNFFKHLFRGTIHENLPALKKKHVRNYLSEAGYYSYDAASEDEDPVKRWIGREVRRFLTEAHKHLPFLLRLANAPMEVIPESVQHGEQGPESMNFDDDEFAPTKEEIAAEEREEPEMMRHADMWDNYLEWVRAIQAPWDESDSTPYREKRAVEYFNHSMRSSRDLHELKPTMQSWVPHVSCFIVPRQIVALGDPESRACDANESYGALVKHVIKHQTCRRRIKGEGTSSSHTRGEKSWTQTFRRGYIEQAFRRCCAREALLHGVENEPYLGREDWRLKEKALKREQKESERIVPPTVRSLMCADCDTVIRSIPEVDADPNLSVQ